MGAMLTTIQPMLHCKYLFDIFPTKFILDTMKSEQNKHSIIRALGISMTKQASILALLSTIGFCSVLQWLTKNECTVLPFQLWRNTINPKRTQIFVCKQMKNE